MGSLVGCSHPKPLSKHSHMESLVDTISNQAQLSELVRGMQDARMAHFNIKCKKLELQLKLK